MLSLVVLQALGEAETGVAEAHERAVISTARDAVQPEHGQNAEARIVDRARCPGVASELSAGTVVGLGAEDSQAGRIDATIVGNHVTDDVIGKRRYDFVAGLVQPLREVRGSIEALLFAGISGEVDSRLQSARDMLRD